MPWLKLHVEEYDCVIVNGLWNYASVGASCVLPGGGTPYFVFTHGMLDPWFRQIYPRKHQLKQAFWLAFEGRLLAGAKAVFFTSEEEQRAAVGQFWGYSYNPEVVGYGTADVVGDLPDQLEEFYRRIPALRNRRYLLYLSRIHPKKGCDLLVSAFGDVQADYPELDLVMAGPDAGGFSSDLMARAAAGGYAHRIHWPGMLEGSVKWGAFRGADAFVLPSHQENFGIVVAEALSSAAPVLITDKVNIWREVEAGGGGLVGSDNLEGVRSMLRRWLTLPSDTKAAMRLSARSTFLKNFDIQHFADHLYIRMSAMSQDSLL